MSILDRKVLAQDQPQQDERSGPDRKKREREEEEAYNREVEEVRQQNILIDKQNADAEAKYQKELADFNALQNQKTELQEIELRYAAQVKQVQENKDKVLSDSYNAFWGAGGGHDSGQSRQQFSIEQSNLASSYDILINKILREEQSVKLPILLREEGYAPSVVDKITRNFVKGKYTTIDSAFKRADQFVVGKKAKQEYDAQTQIQLARIAPSYTKEQSNAIETGTTYLRGRATPEMKARAAEIKPTTLPKGTTFTLQPKQAQRVDEIRHLTNVNTGQYIDKQNKPQTNVVANPRAFVLGLERQMNPIKNMIIPPAPITTTGKGTPEDPFVSKQPDRNSVSSYLGATYWTVPGTDKTFTLKSDAENYIRQSTPIRWSVGERTFKSKEQAEKFIQRTQNKETSFIGFSPDGKPIQGPLQTLFTVENVNPKTKGKYPTLTFKSEESANKYLNRTAKSEPFTGLVGNDFFAKNEFVATKPSIVESVTAPKPTSFNEIVEKNYNKLGELEEINARKSKSGNPFDLLVEAAYAPAQLVRVGLGVTASVTNFGEQIANPILFKEAPYLFVTKPPTIPPKEITLKGDTADTTLIPVDFSKGITQPRLLNRQEWAGDQARYIKKYGLISYVAGGSTLLVGVPSLLKSGGVKAMSLIKSPVRSNKFFEKQIPNMLDSGKVRVKKAPFSYDMPYSPTKRANEIKIDSYVEKIGPSTLLSKKPIAARQSDVIIKSGKEIKNIQPDSTYKPATRRNEINLDGGGEKIGPSTLLSKKPIAARQSDVRPFIPEKIQPVKLDPFYKPKKLFDLSQDNKLVEFRGTQIKLGRTNVISPTPKKSLSKIVQEERGYKPKGRFEGGFKDIFFSDKTVPKELSTFKSIKIQLGKAQSKGKLFRGKQPKPVEIEFGFKPAKKSKNIDLSQDNKLVEFKNDEVKMGGTGMEVKSDSQVTIQIQRSESITKKKLERKRQTPVGINWSEKPETVLLPKTEKQPIGTTRSPLLAVIPRIKEKKKYLQEQKQYFDYDVLSDQRPQIKTIEKTIPRLSISSIQRFKTSLSFDQPQKLSTDVKPKTITKQRPQTTQRLTQIPRYSQIFIPRQAQKVVQVPKLSAPLAPKQPQRLAQPQKIKPIEKLTFEYKRPPAKKPPRTIIPFALPPEEKKTPVKRTYQPGDKADFLGNVSESQIGGIFNRSEVTYGQRKINKLLAGDRRVVRGGKRATSRQAKWVEGKGKDPFGFKYEAKKKKSFKLSL